MKMFVLLAAALLIAGPAAAQSSHAEHHPAVKPLPATSDGKGCPKMDEMSGTTGQMKQTHQQMTSEMQQHQAMGMAMPKSTPPADDKPH